MNSRAPLWKKQATSNNAEKFLGAWLGASASRFPQWRLLFHLGGSVAYLCSLARRTKARNWAGSGLYTEAVFAKAKPTAPVRHAVEDMNAPECLA